MGKFDINPLKQWINKPLPGKVAQDIMLPFPSRNKIVIPDTYKKAGVMILLFEDMNEWKMILIQRSHHPSDKHAGQISLPGGQLDSIDMNSLEKCAIRETHEEIGARPNQIKVFKTLTPLYVPVSGFMVYPHIGLYEGHIDQFNKQDDEVEKLIIMPLSTLVDNRTVGNKTLKLNHGTYHNVPYFDIDDHVVWGATAMILSEFKTLINQH